ncbi:MAG TPA: hypothetical protein VFG20_07105, partial [Planctomycetaceae bacterium]|nr:hypothetical protein [Planctomycetaceae bacterium]
TQDVQAQLGNAISNNSALFFDNGLNVNGNAIVDGQQPAAGFNFSIIDAEAAQKPAEQAAKQAQDSLKSSGNLDARNAYRARNEGQLLDLNKEIAGKKLQQKGQSFGVQPADEFTQRRSFQEDRFLGDRASSRFNRGDNSGSGADHRFGTNTNRPAVSANGDMLPELSSSAGVGVGGAMGGGGLGGFGPMNGRGLIAADDMVQLWADGGQAVQLGGEWKQTGGLSLAMPLPTSGQKLVFAKSGGDARLALLVRPRRVLSLTLGLIWTICCFALAAAFFVSGRSARLRRFVPVTIALLAAVGVVVLAGPLSVIAFVVFFIAALQVAWMYRQTSAV